MGHILLVDDDDVFRPALQKTLTHLGHQVVPARNGVDGLAIFKHTEFDLVISDIRMPDMDGIALTKEIKALRKTPVILITGFAEILETHEAHQLGADEFLPKPFEREDIVSSIARCLGPKEAEQSQFDINYCKLGIDDFTSGRQIRFGIYVRLAQNRFVKIANQGEDIPFETVRLYKRQGVRHLYLRREDFRSFIGFSGAFSKSNSKNRIIPEAKKAKLLKLTAEILANQIPQYGIDNDFYGGSVSFVETTVDILSDEPELCELLEKLNLHSEYLYVHSLGTCLFSIMIADMVNWRLPVNKFKVAMGGLLHDVGLKDIEREIQIKPRSAWSYEEIKKYESHPLLGLEILGKMNYIPSDVIHIVKEHHEDGLGQGFPSHLRKAMVHPMAKLVTVANEFCNRVMIHPQYQKLTPHVAIAQMAAFNADRLDPSFLSALMKLFSFTSPQEPSKRRT